MKEYKIKINGNDFNVAIDEVEDTTAKIEVNGTPYTVEFERPVAKKAKPRVAAPKAPAAAPVNTPSAAPVAAAPAGGNTITSPLPGVILDLKISVGDTVKKGQTIIVLEAMKMENAVESTCDGVVKSIKVGKGDSVLEGAPLVVIG